MALRLEIDGHKVTGLDDVHDLVAALPGLPEWFGRNLDALAELAYFVPEPLEIVVVNAEALKRNLGARYATLIQTFEDVRDSPKDDSGWQPATLSITSQEAT